MARSDRFFLTYIDDSGNENVGALWTALAIPAEWWTEYLRRWLQFRKWLNRTEGVPASFELHATVWLSAHPREHMAPEDLALVEDNGQLVEILRRGRDHRRARSRVYEKALATVGTFIEARLLTVFTPDSSGPSKIALYDQLLCFLEECFLVERGHGTLVVDGGLDSGGHMRMAHRALRIGQRRTLEDACMRKSMDSQLLQIVDFCAYAALQSIQENPSLDEKFVRQYDTALDRIIERPFGEEEGRSIRGLDYDPGPLEACPSERINP